MQETEKPRYAITNWKPADSPTDPIRVSLLAYLRERLDAVQRDNPEAEVWQEIWQLQLWIAWLEGEPVPVNHVRIYT